MMSCFQTSKQNYAYIVYLCGLRVFLVFLGQGRGDEGRWLEVSYYVFNSIYVHSCLSVRQMKDSFRFFKNQDSQF